MIELIDLWFKRAVPEPTDKNRAVQIGVHFEEVTEMLSSMDEYAPELSDLANLYKNVFTTSKEAKFINKQEFLDSLCDQIVTAVGVAHMFGFNIVDALKEVNRSNWSKFDSNGNPIFDANGKIAKGPNYSKPDLSRFVNAKDDT